MIFMLICTEGDVSEPAYIRAASKTLGSQVPRSVSTNIEVLPISLGGNQGHTELIAAADKAIEKYSADSVLSIAGDEDTIEKWIIVDYDDMDKHGVNPTDLRQEAKNAGYALIISKPNFEFFVLASLTDTARASAVGKNQIVTEIELCIKSLNEIDSNQKGFSKEMLMPASYSKKTHVAEKLFSCMLLNHPELIANAAMLYVDIDAEHYTEMPEIVKRLMQLYE